MSRRLGPVKRRDLISRLKMLGWRGPIPSRHDYMVLGARKVRIPNVKEIDAGLRRAPDVDSAVGAVRETVESQPYLWANLIMIDEAGGGRGGSPGRPSRGHRPGRVHRPPTPRRSLCQAGSECRQRRQKNSDSGMNPWLPVVLSSSGMSLRRSCWGSASVAVGSMGSR